VLISWHTDASPSDSSGVRGASCRRRTAWHPENNSVRFSDDWEIRKNGAFSPTHLVKVLAKIFRLSGKISATPNGRVRK
jgi:hypothetical protein